LVGCRVRLGVWGGVLWVGKSWVGLGQKLNLKLSRAQSTSAAHLATKFGCALASLTWAPKPKPSN